MGSKHRTAGNLVKRLSSASDSDEFDPDSLAEILTEIRRLTKLDPEIRAPLADAGAVPILARHLAREDASAALLNLSISSREPLMSTPGLLDALALALALRSPAAPSHAAATLYSLLSVDAYRPIIGSKRAILVGLLTLLPSPAARDALKALFALALYPLNRAAVLDLGAAPPLFALIRGNRFLSDATAVVAQLSGCYEAVDAFRRVGGVRVLVDLVDGGGGRGRENAAAALLNLAMFGGERAVGDIREVEGAEAVVAELAESGSERGKEKAEALLRILVSGRAGLRRRMDDFDLPSPPCSASSVDTSTTNTY